MYTVIELSDMLGISKQAMYKKIESLEDELKEFISKESNILRINEDGLEILKKNISPRKNKSEKQIDNYKFKMEKALYETLENEIEYLKEQLRSKDSQLMSKDEQLESKDKQLINKDKQLSSKDSQLMSKDDQLNKKDELMKNMQVLLKNSQELLANNQVKLLEEKKKPIFERIFKKFNIN